MLLNGRLSSWVQLHTWQLAWTMLLVTPILAIPTSSIHRRKDSNTFLYDTRFENVSWNNADWQLTTRNLDQGHYQSRVSIANGYIGINVAALGPFFEYDTPVDGDDITEWPIFTRRQTFATVGGFWDSQPTTNGTNFPWLNQYGGESIISGIPHWSGILLQVGDAILNTSTDASEITNFSSTLDVKRGLMNWSFVWTPSGSSASFGVTYELFVHKLHVNQAFVQMSIVASSAANVTIFNVLDGDCAVRTDFVEKGEDSGMIYSAVSPNGIENVTAFIYAGLQSTVDQNASAARIIDSSETIGKNESSIAQSFEVLLSAGKEVNVTKFVGIASTDGFSDPQAVAKHAASIAKKNGYDMSLSAHVGEWSQILTSDKVDDYSYSNGSLPNDAFIVEQAITAVTNPYYLLQQTIGQNALAAVGNASINSHSISVGGLGSDDYGGMIFWDAELWMQPGLVASFPEAARGIANYRLERFGQARENTKTAYQSSKNDTTFSDDSAVFSWTSGRFGNCTGTGPCFDYEYHINGDIAQSLANYWVASGDTDRFEEDYFPIYDGIASFYSQLLTKNGSQWSLTNVTDPDEYANHVDNAAYTMALVSDTLANANKFRSMFAMEENSTWSSQSQNVIISRNEEVGITLEYTGMNGSIDVKQADVVLNTYPLRYETNYTSEDSLNDLDYYAGKQSSSGPGMTYAIFSIVANEVSPSGCSSYTYHQYSTHPYARGPWFQFSEQLVDEYALNGGYHPAYPFLTGHGGANQVVLFGYLGFRLVPDYYLYIDPSLPPQIPQIRYRTFYWHGWPISAFSNSTHTTLTRLSTALTTANTTYTNSSIPVLVGSYSNETAYSLAPNGSLTISNRMSAFNLTVPGNILQCQKVVSSNTFEPGQFPISAVDGASSTKWQPSSANENASLTVKVGATGERIRAVYFDWGNQVPVEFSMVLWNGSSLSAYNGGGVKVASNYQVRISSPFNLSAEAEIVSPTSNVSWFNVESDDLYASDYATLMVRGNQAYGTKDEQRFNSSAAGGSVAEWAILNEDSDVVLGKRSSDNPRSSLLYPQRPTEEQGWSIWLREVEIDPFAHRSPFGENILC